MQKFNKKFKIRKVVRLNKKNKIVLTRRQLLRVGARILRKNYFIAKSVVKPISLKNILLALRYDTRPVVSKPKKLATPALGRAVELTEEVTMLYAFSKRTASLTKLSNVSGENLVNMYGRVYASLYNAEQEITAPTPKKEVSAAIVVEKPIAVEKPQPQVSSKNWIPEEIWKTMSGQEKRAFLRSIGKVK